MICFKIDIHWLIYLIYKFINFTMCGKWIIRGSVIATSNRSNVSISFESISELRNDIKKINSGKKFAKSGSYCVFYCRHLVYCMCC